MKFYGEAGERLREEMNDCLASDNDPDISIGSSTRRLRKAGSTIVSVACLSSESAENRADRVSVVCSPAIRKSFAPPNMHIRSSQC